MRPSRMNPNFQDQWAANPRPSPIDLLRARRENGGFSVEQVAEIDGLWTPVDVKRLEAQDQPHSATLLRYIHALRRLEDAITMDEA